MDYSQSYLYVKMKITKPGETNLNNNGKVAPVNLFFHVLFSQIDVSLIERAIS